MIFVQCVLRRSCSECCSEGCCDCSLLRFTLGGCSARVVRVSHIGALSGVGGSIMSTVILPLRLLKAIRMLLAEKLLPGAGHVLSLPSQHEYVHQACCLSRDLRSHFYSQTLQLSYFRAGTCFIASERAEALDAQRMSQCRVQELQSKEMSAA